jgi:Domain of unknown function (DUF4265)
VTDLRKIGFRLEKDEMDYPPAENEWLWASAATGGRWVIDNIPWYSRHVSVGDVIETDEDEDEQLWFRETVEPSGHSTLRVLMRDRDPAPTAALRARLEELDCSSEQWSEELPLLAIDIPPEVDLKPVIDLLEEGETRGTWGWETGLISERHGSEWPT